MHDYLRYKLTHDAKTMLGETQGKFTVAASRRVAMGDVISGGASFTCPFENVEVAGGSLPLTANAHDFGVEVLLPASSVGDACRAKWIRAETVSPSDADHIEDSTDAMGMLLSPTVSLEFEGRSADALSGPVTVLMPTAMGSRMDDGTEMMKEDLLVVYATWATARWVEVAQSEFKLLPRRRIPGVEQEMPFVAVRVPTAGLVCVYSRHDPVRKPAVRVLAYAYVPEIMSPLELQLVNVYLCPAIPDAMVLARLREQHERGTVLVGGQSEVFEVHEGARVIVRMGVAEGLVEGEVIFDGDLVWVPLQFDPDDVRRQQSSSAPRLHGSDAPPTPDAQGVDVDTAEPAFLHIAGALAIRIDLNRGSNLHQARHARLAATNERGAHSARRRGAMQIHAAGVDFPCRVTIHEFSPPSAPRKLRIHTRTGTALTLVWEHPRAWGGCALHHYEVQMRKIRANGDASEWTAAGVCAASHCDFTIYERVRVCTFARVRVHICAFVRPGACLSSSAHTHASAYMRARIHTCPARHAYTRTRARLQQPRARPLPTARPRHSQ